MGVSNKEIILIVDDNIELARTIEEILDTEGYCYETVHDGEQALVKFEKIKPSLVILDVDIPKIDGITVCKKIKTKKNFTPVIMMTGKHSSVQEKIDGINVGADDYLTKPFDLEELIARTRTVLHLKHLYDGLEESKKLYREQSLTDHLTSVYNRRYLMRRLGEEIKRAVRASDEFSCMMIDVDKFKELNDAHGHLFGDDVLKRISSVLKQTARETDIIARYGGDEFIIIMPSTGKKGALRLAEKLFHEMEENYFKKDEHSTRVTISAGISSFDGKSVEDRIITASKLNSMIDALIRIADQSLYNAKKEKGNSSFIAP